MSGGSRVYQISSRSGQVRGSRLAIWSWPWSRTQLPVTGNVNFLPTESAVQPLLSGFIRRAESPGLVLPRVEMVPPGDTRVSGGTGDREFTLPDKPFNFGNFSRAARFANSLTNGKVLSRTQSTSRGFKYVTYEVRLSPDTERGMYDLSDPATARAKPTGFVIPSNNEWVKAAYYDPEGGGTDSYWAYPADPFKQPNVAVLNPGTGDVENASDQPLSTYNPNDPNSSSDTRVRRQERPRPGARRKPDRAAGTSRPIERIYPWYGFRVGVIGTP